MIPEHLNTGGIGGAGPTRVWALGSLAGADRGSDLRRLGDVGTPEHGVPGHELSFDEKLGIVVDREWTDRENRRLGRRIKDARLSTRASLDNVLREPERGLEKATIRQLATCSWTKAKQNVVIVGKTGVGKSYLASALADAACRQG